MIQWHHWKHFPGILLARTYASCNHNRVALVVLGILLICSLVPYIVCGYTFTANGVSLTFHSWQYQLIAVLSPLHSSKLPICVYFKIWPWGSLTDMHKSGVWHILFIWRVDLLPFFQNRQLAPPLFYYLTLLSLLWHFITCWGPGTFRRGLNLCRKDPWQSSCCNRVSYAYVSL